MSGNGETMLVQKISDGTVIDHVAAGKALSVLRLLGNPQERGVTVAPVMNVGSSKMGKKDILKVEGVELTDEQIQKLALDSAPGQREHHQVLQRLGEEVRSSTADPARHPKLHRDHVHLGQGEGLDPIRLLARGFLAADLQVQILRQGPERRRDLLPIGVIGRLFTTLRSTAGSSRAGSPAPGSTSRTAR